MKSVMEQTPFLDWLVRWL